MSKKKKLPLDHTTEAIVRPKIREEVVEKVIQEVKEWLSIDSGFDLYGWVGNARRNYFLALHAERENPPLHEQRILFEDVAAKSKALQYCISRLGYLEQVRLGMDLMDRLEYDLPSLESRAGRELSGGKGKRDKPLRLFIQEMHAIYFEATGDDDKYTKGANEITGLFFEFLKTLLPTIDVKKTDSALYNDIKRALSTKNTS